MNLNEFRNTTRSQHYVSQAEQRMNSCSADPQSKKANTYRFSIVDRKDPAVRSDGKSQIGRALEFPDLFTLVRVGDKERLNFEHLFGRYESRHPELVASLLKMINDVRSHAVTRETIDLTKVGGFDFAKFLGYVKFIYTYKTMNWLRNPHKIKEVLKNFSPFLDHSLDKPGALALYLALTDKNSSEEAYICNTYDISSGEYKQWIRLLLLFLYTEDGETPSLDGFVEEFFIAKEFSTTVFVSVFDELCALLTDTGVVKESTAHGPATYMNVSKNCVIAIQHTFVEGEFLDKLMGERAGDLRLREQLKAKIATTVNGVLSVNDYRILQGYNQICVKAAAVEVFCATPDIHGVKVLKSEKAEK
ncbi:hypothetical protein ACVWYU_000153 [Pseudomonas sp. TE12234]